MAIFVPRRCERSCGLVHRTFGWLLIASSVLVALALIIWGGTLAFSSARRRTEFPDGWQVEMVLPVAFELDAAAARRPRGPPPAAQSSRPRDAAVPGRGRPWLAIAGAALMIGLALWCSRSSRRSAARCATDSRSSPSTPFAFGGSPLRSCWPKLARAASIYFAHVYVAAHFAADHLRFTAWPDVDVLAIVSALILLVLAEVFRTGTRLDEDQSLTV